MKHTSSMIIRGMSTIMDTKRKEYIIGDVQKTLSGRYTLPGVLVLIINCGTTIL